MVFADLQPLHVHGEAGPQPRTGAPVCRGALSHELRQSGSSLYTRRRRVAAVANTSPRWLRCLAASRGPTGILQAAICQVGLKDRDDSASANRSPASSTVKDSGQLIRVFAFAVEGPPDGSEGLGERKNFARNQQIGIFRPDRMPVHTLS